MQRRFLHAGIVASDWEAFRMVFAGDVDGVVARELESVKRAIEVGTEGIPGTPPDLSQAQKEKWPLVRLRAARDEAKKVVGIDVQKQKRYDDLQRAIGNHDASLRRIELEIKEAEAAGAERVGLITRRRTTYSEAWRTIVEEEEVLRQLYAPLERALVDREGALRKLAFVVRRKVDLQVWVVQGEKLFDLRKESRFRGHGALRKEAEGILLHGWLKGSADEVASSMEGFLREMQPEFGKAKPTLEPGADREWTQSVGDWLFSTEHISVQYGITYDGVAIEQLSPGTRGIVLLLLYLTLDQHDM